MLDLKGDSSDVNLFAETVKFGGPVPGLPEMDPNRVINGGQSIEILNPLPTSGELEIHSKLNGVYDKGSGILLERINTMIDPKTGKEYCVMTLKTFVLGYGGFGGPKGKKSPSHEPPKDKKPDAIDVSPTSPTQALLYRLSG